ncbi:MAG: pentapeptide repeat-containing protein [Oceanospirillales bacterium]|uniref:Pentapeptide repeat protein n=1 Tax=Marinobacterium halophilum TaxID=267374 RepID=A0A2P8F4S0_9GAMM|nr:pentapeptide repeat-containing protein [Marinobacterium halophilum]MBR9828088.1 pentapeptide repeat-containing protein [Oceanospirillales bacterium]PSL16701.1 pentapeptide repeat protein [Marinobacterium halophilum]
MKVDNDTHYFEVSFDKQVQIPSTLNGAEFEACTFTECDFSSAVFTRCKFIDCTFTRCNLSLLSIPYSRFFEVNFIECKLVGVDWTRADWPSFNRDAELVFRRCILNDASFFGLTLHGLKLDACKLHEVDFREGDFTGAAMTHCDFSQSLFMHTNLRAVDFTESCHFSIDVLENQLAKARFSRHEALGLLDSLNIELVD